MLFRKISSGQISSDVFRLYDVHRHIHAVREIGRPE